MSCRRMVDLFPLGGFLATAGCEGRMGTGGFLTICPFSRRPNLFSAFGILSPDTKPLRGVLFRHPCALIRRDSNALHNPR